MPDQTHNKRNYRIASGSFLLGTGCLCLDGLLYSNSYSALGYLAVFLLSAGPVIAGFTFLYPGKSLDFLSTRFLGLFVLLCGLLNIAVIFLYVWFSGSFMREVANFNMGIITLGFSLILFPLVTLSNDEIEEYCDSGRGKEMTETQLSNTPPYKKIVWVLSFLTGTVFGLAADISTHINMALTKIGIAL